MFVKEVRKDNLVCRVYANRDEMGKAAAKDIAAAIKEVLKETPVCNMIFAAAPSQNEVLAAVASDPSIDFSRVNAFHMDEYIGLSADAPQGFGNFLTEHLFGRLPFGQVFRLDPSAKDPQAECARYAALLKKYLKRCHFGFLSTILNLMSCLQGTRPLP